MLSVLTCLQKTQKVKVKWLFHIWVAECGQITTKRKASFS